MASISLQSYRAILARLSTFLDVESVRIIAKGLCQPRRESFWLNPLKRSGGEASVKSVQSSQEKANLVHPETGVQPWWGVHAAAVDAAADAAATLSKAYRSGAEREPPIIAGDPSSEKTNRESVQQCLWMPTAFTLPIPPPSATEQRSSFRLDPSEFGAEPLEAIRGADGGGSSSSSYPGSDSTSRTAPSPFQDGRAHMQSLSSLLPALCLDVRAGHAVLDLCAAPGGKAALLAIGLQGRGLLVANDSDHGRADRLRHTLHQLLPPAHLALVRITEQDGRLLRVDEQGRTLSWDGRGEGWASSQRHQSGGGGLFDRVLVDVPCSGSGRAQYFAEQESVQDAQPPASDKNFDAYEVGEKPKKSKIDVISERYQVEGGSQSAVARQQALLWNAARLLRPGGFLVYSTCSLWQEENENVVAFLLSHAHEMQLVDVTLPKDHVMSLSSLSPAAQETRVSNGPSLLRREKSDVLVDVLNSFVPDSAMPGCYSNDDPSVSGGGKRKAASRLGMEKCVRVLPNEFFEGFFMAKFRKAKQK